MDGIRVGMGGVGMDGMGRVGMDGIPSSRVGMDGMPLARVAVECCACGAGGRAPPRLAGACGAERSGAERSGAARWTGGDGPGGDVVGAGLLPQLHRNVADGVGGRCTTH